MNWERIFSLIDRTKGKHFIVDKNNEKVYVIMPLDEYEQHIAQDDFVDLPENDDFVEPAPEALSEIEKEPAVADEQFYIEPLE